MSFSDILKILALLPFSGVIRIVFPTKSMSSQVISKISPLLAPVSEVSLLFLQVTLLLALHTEIPSDKTHEKEVAYLFFMFLAQKSAKNQVALFLVVS